LLVSLPRIHYRNLLIVVVVTILLPMVWQAPRLAMAQTASPSTITLSIAAGSSSTSSFTLTNNTATAQTFTLNTQNVASGLSVSIAPNSFTLNASASQSGISVVVSVAAGTAVGSYPFSITATSTGGTVNVVNVVVNVSAQAAITNTPTPTTGPTCPEANDPGNDFGSARQILIDTPNNHGICFAGDEDWFKFAAIGNKVYTLDITRFEAGLDLVLELYDDQGVRLAFNDDFFGRTPAPTSAALTPLPTRDIAPRIQSWRAPRDGIYYVRIRDAAGVGGNNKTYTFVVFSESYGPTPPTVTEICRDLYEEDGLPEQARLITSNEVQPSHRLCPDGDADWVKFFGKAGKTYYIYTDTRPYRNNPAANPANSETQAGADTVMYLADRDGASIIDFNDDIETADSSSLDSQIRFVPRVDGFYFVQIKNTGDIGNQFIRYDLVLTQCAPGKDDCGRARTTVNVVPTPQPAATQTPVNFGATATPITPTPTILGFLEQDRTTAMVNGAVPGFADPAFERTWRRTDATVAAGNIQRSWIWGPVPRMARSEGYLQAASGLRQVQYFDKGRMEVTSNTATNQLLVTNGLLALELVSGRMQVGDNDFVQRVAADIPIAGDINNPNAPTYASFSSAVAERADDRSGALPLTLIDRAGNRSQLNGAERPETRLVRYVPETGHNIAQVFWEYLNAEGPIEVNGRASRGVLVDWVSTMGYPVSEPTWVETTVGGNPRLVLVQVFERRVLTYDPANPSGWKIEMGNVGRHYYLWRYGEALPE
jgi:hypothetical protein